MLYRLFHRPVLRPILHSADPYPPRDDRGQKWGRMGMRRGMLTLCLLCSLTLSAQTTTSLLLHDEWGEGKGMAFTEEGALFGGGLVTMTIQYAHAYTIALDDGVEALLTERNTIRLKTGEGVGNVCTTFSLTDFRFLVQEDSLPPTTAPEEEDMPPTDSLFITNLYLTKNNAAPGDSLYRRRLPFQIRRVRNNFIPITPTDAPENVITLPAGEYMLYFENLLTPSGTTDFPARITLAIETGARPPARDSYTLDFTGSNTVTEFTCWNADGTQGLAKTTLFDDFGREERTILERCTPGNRDLVSLTEFDAFGRKTHQWMPTPVDRNGTVNGRSVPAPEIKAAAIAAQQGDGAPFALTQYEHDPLARVAAVTGAGEAWHNTGRAVTSMRMTNSTSVDSLRCPMLQAEDNADTVVNIRCTGYYPTGSLYVERTADEDGRTMLTFTDKQGRKVLTRRMTTTGTDGNLSTSQLVYLSTYYIYDEFGLLRAVLPPAVEEEDPFIQGSSVNTETRNKFSYLYQYDARGNLIAKKLPGCAWTTYCYDGGGRLVFSQDGRQRQAGRMTYILYDLAGREAVRGICDGYPEQYRSSMCDLHARAPFTGDIHSTQLGYSLPSGFPALSNALALSANYYDSYSFNDSICFPMPDNMVYDGHLLSYRAADGHGLLTGTAIRSGETPTSDVLYGMTVYSVLHKQPVYTVAQNLLGGTDITQTTYDYAGRPVEVSLTHTAAIHAAGSSTSGAQMSPSACLRTHYSYDNGGRIATVTQTLNDGAPVVIAQNEYDELGRLTRRQRADNDRLAVSYTYNIRNWTTSITSAPFEEYLYYNTAHHGSTPQWAGNISAIDWKNGENGNDNGNDSIPAGGGVIVTLNSLRPGAAAGVLGGEEGNTGGAVDDNPSVPDGALNGLEGYSFAYDALSRLTAADYHRNDSRSNDYDTRYTYDSMGNILTLKRRGMMEKPDTAAHTPATYADIDDLTFDYDGNQIVKVTDAVDDGPYYQGAWHYSDNADAQQERFYDGNGNLTKDLDAKISDIQYNSLNLPIMITFTDGSTTRYTYDATGRKLRTEHRVMTTGVFNPGLDDGGTAVPDTGGIALPFPDDPGLAVGEGGLGAWPEMSVFEELEQLLGEELAEGEEMEAGGETALPATELPVPVGTGTSSLPYELTVDAKINSLSNISVPLKSGSVKY